MKQEVPFGRIVTPNMYQKICRPEHFMKKFQGFGISESILWKLEEDGVKLIQIVYLGQDTTTYIATLRQYLESIKEHVNEQDDKQKFVSTCDMVRY